MKKKLIIFLTGIAILVSLVIINPGQFFTFTLLRILGHYKSPKIETSQSIIEYVKSKNLFYDKLYGLSTMNALNELGHSGVKGVPTIQIFNKDKVLLRMAGQNECTWVLANYFKSGHSAEMIVQDSTTYGFVMDRLIPLDIKTTQDTFDFYLISYWAKYIPKLSNRLFEQTNNMKAGMSQNICFIYVTLDEQESWEDGFVN